MNDILQTVISGVSDVDGAAKRILDEWPAENGDIVAGWRLTWLQKGGPM